MGGRTWEEAVGPIQERFMTPSPNAWDGNPSTSSRTPSLVAKTNTEVNPKGKGKHRQPRPQPYGRQQKGGYQQKSPEPEIPTQFVDIELLLAGSVAAGPEEFMEQ